MPEDSRIAEALALADAAVIAARKYHAAVFSHRNAEDTHGAAAEAGKAWHAAENAYNRAIECPLCGGGGEVTDYIEHVITRDMALDACEPSMEGQVEYEAVRRQCPECHGTGNSHLLALARTTIQTATPDEGGEGL